MDCKKLAYQVDGSATAYGPGGSVMVLFRCATPEKALALLKHLEEHAQDERPDWDKEKK